MADVLVTYGGWSAGEWGSTAWGTDIQMPSATGAVGTVTVAGEANVSVTGVVGTTQLGIVTVDIITIVLVTGVSAVGNIGQVNVWGEVDDNQNPNWQNIIAA